MFITYTTRITQTSQPDTSTKGLGATLWQQQSAGEIKTIAYASRFLLDTEKRYADNELKLQAAVWG